MADDPVDIARDRLDELDDRLDHYRTARDLNVENILAATDFDDADEFWADLRAGDTVSIEIDIADLIVILSQLEAAIAHPDGALDLVHTLDVFLEINDQARDELEAYAHDRFDAIQDKIDDHDTDPGFQ